MKEISWKDPESFRFSQNKQKIPQLQKAILLATFWIWLSKMLTSSAYDEKFFKTSEGRILTKFCYTPAEQAEQTASWGIELDVYLKCAPAFMKYSMSCLEYTIDWLLIN